MTEEQREQRCRQLYGRKERHGEELQKYIGMLRDMELQFMSWDVMSRKLMENVCEAIKHTMEEMDAVDETIESLGL